MEAGLGGFLEFGVWALLGVVLLFVSYAFVDMNLLGNKEEPKPAHSKRGSGDYKKAA